MARVKIARRDEGTWLIEIDGQKITDVVAIGFDASVDEQAEVTLVLAPSQIEFEGDVDKINQAQLKAIDDTFPNFGPLLR